MRWRRGGPPYLIEWDRTARRYIVADRRGRVVFMAHKYSDAEGWVLAK